MSAPGGPKRSWQPIVPPRWRLDPAVSVVPGEILDDEVTAAELLDMTAAELSALRVAGRSPVPFIAAGGRFFYPRRSRQPLGPRAASEGLLRAIASMEAGERRRGHPSDQ